MGDICWYRSICDALRDGLAVMHLGDACVIDANFGEALIPRIERPRADCDVDYGRDNSLI